MVAPRFAVLVFLAALSGGAASSQPAELRSLVRPRSARVIVEFHGAPAALSGRVTAMHRDTHAQFARDLAALAGVASKSTEAPAIRRAYSVVLFGAAVEAPRAFEPAIRALPYVRALHEDGAVEAFGGEVVDAGARVNALALPFRGEGVTVAVIDSGIDYLHPALGGGFGPGFKVAGGWDFVNDDADPRDDHGHGTHVAGIVAAESEELVGVAPRATLYAYKVLRATGGGLTSDVIAAIERSADPNGDGNPADHLGVVNLSLGGRGTADDVSARAADNAVTAGVIVVVAAGNSGDVATIASPGAARSAITVGATDGNRIAAFSSAGPTSKHLAFKPDVVAPGARIRSARLGGGLIDMSGTSMAAPHVAGIAALLRRLHPDWTAAHVKAAITSGTLGFAGDVVRRGAGFADAQKAHEATLIADVSGVSFGLNGERTGTLQATRTIALTNRSSTTQTYTANATPPPEGAAIDVTPFTFTLAPGATEIVTLRLDMDNALMAFPAQLLAGGTVTFSSDRASLALPWTLLRGARATMTYDGTLDAVFAFRDAGLGTLTQYERAAAEMFVVAGTQWDVLIMGHEGTSEDPSQLRFVLFENRTVEGDQLLAADAADAPLRIGLDARNEEGVPIGSLPQIPNRREHFTTMHLGRDTLDLDGSIGPVHTIYSSPLPERFHLGFSQTLIDLEEGRVFHAEHDELAGVTEEKTLTRDLSSYAQARVRWRTGVKSGGALVCSERYVVSATSLQGLGAVCLTEPVGESLTMRYYTTSESETGRASALRLVSAAMHTPLMRGIDGEVVMSNEPVPALYATHLPADEEVAIGGGPVHPFSFFGTGGLGGPLRGMFGETRFADWFGTYWTMYDAAGNVKSSGTIDPFSVVAAPVPQTGYRFVAGRDHIPLAGHIAQGTLDVRFTATAAAETVAPTLTSLSIADSTGRTAERLAVNEPGALRFSAADLTLSGGIRSLISKPEATRVAYRVSGTSQWIPLPYTLIGTENGTLSDLGHIPAGDLYLADLGPVTARGNALIDLRIEIEDLAGNHLTWTHAPALIVGDVPPPKRRRAVRQ